MNDLIKYAAPLNKNPEITLRHEYITNCQSLDTVRFYLNIIIGVYILVLVSWIISIWCVYQQEHQTLQKAMMIIPLFMIIKASIYSLYIEDCPWQDQLTGRYLLMALVTVSTIHQTVFVSILLLISKGWVLIRSSLSRQQATSVTMLMGAVYLTYSAYYVSNHIESVRNLITMVLNLIYLSLFYVVVKNATNVLTVLRMHYQVISNNEVGALQDTIRLKMEMI